MPVRQADPRLLRGPYIGYMEVLGIIAVVLLAVAKVSLFAIAVRNALKPKATGRDDRLDGFGPFMGDPHEFPLFPAGNS